MTRPYAIEAVRFHTMELLVRRACSAAELCHDLGLSKAAQRRLLAHEQLGLLCDDGVRPLHAGSTLSSGSKVELRFAPPTPSFGNAAHTTSPSLHLPRPRILWQDRFALAAHKPCGLLVHPDGSDAPTLAAQVQLELRDLAREHGWPFVPVAQAVNRLDVETSGIVLFSLTSEFQPAFDALFASHEPGVLRKRYLAIATGRVPARPRVINQPIARDRHDAQHMRVGKTGKPSQTKVACLDYRNGLSLVGCELLSGRRHQIRVHMAHDGHALLGDALYGKPGGPLMLHAAELAFVHPVTGERHVLRTEWPMRFANLFCPRDVDWSILEHT